MTIAKAFSDYLVNAGVCQALGTDLFIGTAPSSNKVVDAIWWIKISGGSKQTKLASGESIKNYLVEVYRRSRDYQQVNDDMESLEELLNCNGCVQLEGFDTLQIEATSFPIDNDLDSEDRKVGLLQATLSVYKSC